MTPKATPNLASTKLLQAAALSSIALNGIIQHHQHELGPAGKALLQPCPSSLHHGFQAAAYLQDVLNEVERNLHDAMGVARNVAMDPRLVPGGGAVEMAVSRGIHDRAATVSLLLPMRSCCMAID